MRVQTVAVGVALLVLALVAGFVALRALGTAGAAAGSGAPTAALAAPRFLEESQAAGLAHAYQGGFEFYVGGGLATFDCNGDALPELYFAGGTAPSALFVNRSELGGRLRFAKTPGAATDLGAVTGAYPLDVDGDGHVDLAVLRRGENALLRGLGKCVFERANELWGFDGGDDWSTAFSAKWDRGSSWPTLSIGNYLEPDRPAGQTTCTDSQLLPPSSSGSSFGAPVALTPGWCTLSMLFSDWDRSGRRDLRVSNDRHYYSDYSDGAEQLWRMAPGEAPRGYTEADGWKRLRVFGMGIGDYDVTGDGYPDYYLTSQADNKLQALAGDATAPDYEDIALRRGVTAQRPVVGDSSMPSTAWHAEFQDLNNDGFVDLFVAKGNVEAMPDHAARDPSNLFLGQPDGSFVERSQEAGIVDYGRARGASLADLNRDGLLDLVVVRRVENVLAYRNLGSGTGTQTAPMGNWLGIDLEWDDANRDAIGSWLEVRVGEHVMQRELTIGGGHVSGELGPVHFGLGTSGNAELRVTWPDGTRSDWQSLAANRTFVISPDSPPQEASAE